MVNADIAVNVDDIQLGASGWDITWHAWVSAGYSSPLSGSLYNVATNRTGLQLNQDVMADAVAAADAQGVTVGIGNKKTLRGGFDAL